jgi:hypothetical protein
MRHINTDSEFNVSGTIFVSIISDHTSPLIVEMETVSEKFFLIGIVGGGVQLGRIGTAATNRRTVPAPGDYDDGEIGVMMIGRGNLSTRRKPDPVPLCPPQTPHALTGREAGPPRRDSETLVNNFGFGRAIAQAFSRQLPTAAARVQTRI